MASQSVGMQQYLSRRASAILFNDSVSILNRGDLPPNFSGESSYRQTMTFLLSMASNRVFPDRELVVTQAYNLSYKRRSYLCRFVNTRATPEEVEALKNMMQDLVAAALDIRTEWFPFDEAISFLEKTNQNYSVKLCKSLNRRKYQMAVCDTDQGPYLVLQHSDFLRNTELLHTFGLFEHNGNIILAFPDQDKNSRLAVPKPEASLGMERILQQGIELGRILGIECVGDINKYIVDCRENELILLSEAFHDMQIVHLADQIAAKEGVKFVMISGPSSSGKTTFASKLALQLRLRGMKPCNLEVDMYFRERADPEHPRDESGELDFENILAVRLDKLQEDLQKLSAGEQIEVPFFDFRDGTIGGVRESLQMDEDGVCVMEGIFCLNEELTSVIPEHQKFKIFMCPITFFNFDNLNFLNEQVVRLIRRISRDHRHRGRQAEGVLHKWSQLRVGEEKNIFPFIDSADAVFNSSVVYEVPVLKVYSRPLLQTVPPDSSLNRDAQNSLNFLDGFVAMSDKGVPDTSLLMEFCSTSIFDQ